MAEEAPTSEELIGCVCFRLRKATRLVSQIYDRALEPFGLTTNQYSLLAHLPRGRQIAMGELAGELGTDATTLTRTLAPLRRRGLLDLVRAPYDARVRLVLSTGAGRALLRDATPAWREARARLQALLDEPRLARLEAALAEILG